MSSLVEFFPQVREISSITQANPAVVTTSEPHEYNEGLYVRITIPYERSMPQINGQVYLATILTESTFSVPVDSRPFDPFITNSLQSAQSVPVAEINSTFQNALQNILV